MLKGIRGFAPTGMLELLKNGITIHGVWLNAEMIL
jgi:hypothetical protein